MKNCHHGSVVIHSFTQLKHQEVESRLALLIKNSLVVVVCRRALQIKIVVCILRWDNCDRNLVDLGSILVINVMHIFCLKTRHYGNITKDKTLKIVSLWFRCQLKTWHLLRTFFPVDKTFLSDGSIVVVIWIPSIQIMFISPKSATFRLASPTILFHFVIQKR